MIPPERPALTTFRIGFHLGEAQRHLDFFSQDIRALMSAETPPPPETIQKVIAPLFLAGEEARILMSRLETLHQFTFDRLHIDDLATLTHRASSSASLETAMNTADRIGKWIHSLQERLEIHFCGIDQIRLSLFNLGFFATLSRSAVDRDIDLRPACLGSALPESVWKALLDAIDGAHPPGLNEEVEAFSRRVTDYFNLSLDLVH